MKIIAICDEKWKISRYNLSVWYLSLASDIIEYFVWMNLVLVVQKSPESRDFDGKERYSDRVAKFPVHI